MSMFDRLEAVERRFVDIEDGLSSGQLDGKKLIQASKDRSSLEELVTAYRNYKVQKQQLAEAKEMLADSKDPEMVALAKQEVSSLQKKIEDSEENLILLSLPKDPNDDKDVYLEIRAGTGGEESSLFVADLLRMYTRYADKQNWRVETMSVSNSSAGGFKEVIILIKGNAVFSRFKFESGTHRVQRVPQTESQGRVHTSACTVAILPEVEDIDVQINPADLEISTFRASGAGGQHVNKTDSAIRILHVPSGLVVECQEERSQHKNKDKALKVLKARLHEQTLKEQEDKVSSDRKNQVGSGDRSERIRTYNFPQGRVTDHRINLTLYNLADFVEGDMDEILNALGSNHQAELLKKSTAS